MRKLLVLLVALALVPAWFVSRRGTDATAPVEPPARHDAVRRAACLEREPSARAADLQIDNVYRFRPHPPVTLPADLTWAENPLGDANWAFKLHTLRFAESFYGAWRATQQRRFLDRYVFLLRDWWEDNPRDDPPSAFSWNDLATGQRAGVYACAWERLPHRPWLREALEAHGEALADPGFYVGRGNHALGQNLGLLAAGCALGHEGWIRTARRRFQRLAAASIDSQGVTNEQAIGYQGYNYRRYGEAIPLLAACGFAVDPALVHRRALMPVFLAHATLPNGYYEQIGDSSRALAARLPGTAAEFAATKGARGVKPAARTAVFEAGYAFGRTGWGESRDYRLETYYSLRFGPGPIIHGHADGTSLNVYGYGKRLLLDPGPYTYNGGPWRAWFKGPSAHNRVLVDGAAFDSGAATVLEHHAHAPGWDVYRLSTRAWSGVRAERSVLFSRAGYLIVRDRLVADRVRTFRQTWHLQYDAAPVIDGATLRTRRPWGNVQMLWLGAQPSLRIVEGATDPIQGWVSYHWNERRPAPVAEAISRGTTVEYLTLIVPAWDRAPVATRDVSSRVDGFALTVEVRGRAERVEVSGDGVEVRPA